MIEWNETFFNAIICRLGWISVVMNCITSVSYSIVVNDCIIGTFHKERGLRQGDPFSSYLISMFTEDLSPLLPKDHRNGLLYGLLLASLNEPRVTHLFLIAFCLLRQI